nr:hypothetical protein [Tanacetum cinerariifolium]
MNTKFGDSYKAPPGETAKDKGLAGEVSASTKKKGRTVAITAEDVQKRKNNVKERTTLLLALPDENQDDLDTMSLDDVYNHLKVYEPEVQKRAGSNSQNIAFISSSNTSSGKSKVPTFQGVSTTSAQVSTDSTDVVAASLSYDTDWSYMAEEDKALKNHALVANEEEVPTEYALMAKSSSSLDNEIGLPEFVDDTVTDYTRPTTSIDVSKNVSKELEERWKINNTSFFEQGGSSGNVVSKPMIKFVKESVSYFDHLEFNCKHDIWVDKGKTWSRVNHAQDNMKYTSTHKSMTPRAVLIKSDTKPIAINRPFSTARPTLNSAQPKMTSFVKRKHSNVKRPFERKSAAKNKVWVPTVRPKIPTVSLKVPAAKPTVAADKGNKGKAGIPHDNIDDKGYWDSGCYRHMTGNISYLSEYEPLMEDMCHLVMEEEILPLIDDKHVLLRTPRQQDMYTIDLKNVVPHKNLTCLIAKALVDESMLWHRRLGHLNFKTMNKLVRSNLVKGLPSKSFENDHSYVACLKGKQHKASCKSKLVNLVSKPLHTLHIDLFGLTSVSSLNHKWYCLVVADDFSRFSWTFFLKSKDETSRIFRNFITKIENLKDLNVKITRSDNEGEFSNKEMDEFCSRKGIKSESSNARTPQQNGVAERRNRTLIEAARTMLADAKLHVTFWAEAVNTACYVQNRVFRKFDAKGDEGYFVGYSLSSKAFRVFNKRTKKIEEKLHVDLLENRSIEKGTGPDWLFDNDTLTNFINYVPVVVTGTSSTNILGTKEDVHQAVKEKKSPLRFITLPNWFHEAQMATSNEAAKMDDAIPDNNAPQKEQEEVNGDKEVPESSGNSNLTPSTKVSSNDSFKLDSSSTVETKVPTVSTPVLTGNAMSFENRLEDFFGDTSDAVSLNDVEADLSNMETAIQFSLTPTLRIHKDHPKSQIISPIDTPVQTRQKTKNMDEYSFIAIIHQKTNPDLYSIVYFHVSYHKKNPRRYAFLYGIINEEVYVMHPPGFQDHEFPHRVYKLEKAMYGLHQAPKAWYGTLTKYLLDNGFQRGTIDQTLFIRKHKGKFFLVQVYVDDIIFGLSNPKLCREFEARMRDKFQMSAIGELNFFLGLQVLQNKDGIFLLQDKYVGDILKKFRYIDIRSAKTPMDKENPWEKDETGKDVELYLYRFMIGSLMYLTASRPDIMFDVYACARHQVIPKECHLHCNTPKIGHSKIRV